MIGPASNELSILYPSDRCVPRPHFQLRAGDRQCFAFIHGAKLQKWILCTAAPLHQPAIRRAVAMWTATVHKSAPGTIRMTSGLGRVVKVCADGRRSLIGTEKAPGEAALYVNNREQYALAPWITLLINPLLPGSLCGILVFTRVDSAGPGGLRRLGCLGSMKAARRRKPRGARELWEVRFAGPSSGRRDLVRHDFACQDLTAGKRLAVISYLPDWASIVHRCACRQRQTSSARFDSPGSLQEADCLQMARVAGLKSLSGAVLT